jgi:Tol biopolymer transport system component
MDASFSPDGKSLAYVAKRGQMPGAHATDSLVVQSLEDANAYPLVVDFSEFHLTHVNDPCWAADGQSIVLVGRRSEEKGLVRGLFRVDLPSLRKTNIYWAPAGYKVGFPECARTTDSVYFDFGGEQLPSTVIRIGMDGRGEQEVFCAPEGQRIKDIALSPDEKILSIIISPSLQSSSRCTLLLLPLDGGPVRQIHEFMQYTGGSVGHAWTPDGKSIFYTVKDKIEEWSWSVHRVSVAGGEHSETVYRRNNPSFGMAFHPNGRMFAFTGRIGSSNTSEIWVMENLLEELKRKIDSE